MHLSLRKHLHGIRDTVSILRLRLLLIRLYLIYFKDYDCGCDCSSLTELMMADRLDFDGKSIMFSSNDTPAEEFAYADKVGAIINLDDITHYRLP